MPDKRTIHFYNVNAENLHDVYNSVTRGVSTYFRSFLESESKVLDIGFGSGKDIVTLLKEDMDANGVEASIGMLNEATKRHPQLMIRVWLDSLPHLKTIEDNSYDAVLCSGVLMHVDEDELPLAVKNIYRVLRKGGKLLISVPTARDDINPETKRDRYGRYYNNYPPHLFKEMFKMVGFKFIFQEEIRDSLRRKFNWIVMGFVKED